jgi:hypothetical protein
MKRRYNEVTAQQRLTLFECDCDARLRSGGFGSGPLLLLRKQRQAENTGLKPLQS